MNKEALNSIFTDIDCSYNDLESNQNQFNEYISMTKAKNSEFTESLNKLIEIVSKSRCVVVPFVQRSQFIMKPKDTPAGKCRIVQFVPNKKQTAL